MSFKPKTISIPQVNASGAGFNDVHISGSNLFLQTDASGNLIGSIGTANISSSYSLTSSYSQTSSNALKLSGHTASELAFLTASNNFTSDQGFSGSIQVLGQLYAANIAAPDGYSLTISSPGGGKTIDIYTSDAGGEIYLDAVGCHIFTDNQNAQAKIWTFDKSGSVTLPRTGSQSILNPDGSPFSASYSLNGFGSNITNISSVSTLIPLISTPTGSYRNAFFDYGISSGSNSRCGTVFGCWNSSGISYSEYSTVDIGNTSTITMSLDISSSNLRFLAISNSTNNWQISILSRYL